MIVALPLILFVAFAMGYVAYKYAVYTVPCLIGIVAGQFAFETNAGWLGSIIITLTIAVASFYGLRRLYENCSTPARWLLGSLYAGCSTIVTYLLLDDLSVGEIPSEIWRQALCLGGAAVAGTLAFSKLRDDC
ncbi:hypothetical protein [Vitreimonas flagellata]|uniref:hypothetical protein n=1 Tax=Vitreimonas flagellata TaxID=2560861 RepID=UPI001074B920|nr:hypothetical protein [Vitreimonas flagellata]